MTTYSYYIILVLVLLMAVAAIAIWTTGPGILARLLSKLRGTPSETPAPEAQRDKDEASIGRSTNLIGRSVCGFALAGGCLVGLWSLKADGDVSQFGTALLIGGAAASVGALLGFIFGIPRTLDPASRAALAVAAQSGPAATSQAALAANTNLERVSDWLTTLLIGATLVQADKVITWVGSLGGAFKGGGTIETVTPLIVVYYSALGFLGIYLVTRLYLTFALQQTLALLTGAVTVGPKIILGEIPKGKVGDSYSFLLRAMGTSPLAWSADRLPAGLAIDAASGKISGNPTAAGKEKYKISVTDGATPPMSNMAEIEIEIAP